MCNHDDIEVIESDRVEWRLADGGNRHRYLVVDQLLTWEEAQSIASRIGGHLATATSAAENTFIAAQAGSRSRWIGGLQDKATEEPNVAWRWIAGEPWEFTAWCPDEPNNANGGEDRLMTFAGQWTDLGCPGQCGYRLPSVIEFGDDAYIRSLDCNDNEILDGCELDAGSASNCNGNGVIDLCDLARGAVDCNANGVIDSASLSRAHRPISMRTACSTNAQAKRWSAAWASRTSRLRSTRSPRTPRSASRRARWSRST